MHWSETLWKGHLSLGRIGNDTRKNYGVGGTIVWLSIRFSVMKSFTSGSRNDRASAIFVVYISFQS